MLRNIFFCTNYQPDVLDPMCIRYVAQHHCLPFVFHLPPTACLNQLAELAGAQVTATAGTRNEGFVKNTLKADDFLDYKSPEGQQLKPPSGKPYDVVIDGTSNLTWKVVRPQLAPKGIWLHLTPPPSFMGVALWQSITFQSQRALPFIAVQKNDDLATLANLVAEGKLKVAKDVVVPFEKAPEAWEKSIAGHAVGKVVVKH